MKIGLLAYSAEQAFFLLGTKKLLESLGHETVLFFNVGMEKNSTQKQVDWINWQIQDIFWADKLIVFNGSAKETVAQTMYLKSVFEEDMFFMERGWLPQKNNVYIDSCGCGGRSALAQKKLTGENKVAKIKELYTRHEDKYQNYILVPLQLEHDTSVTIDSPIFKTMNQLVRYVKYSFPSWRIIVRPHPLQKHGEHLSGIEYVYDKSTVELAQNARMVIGINSTSLIESMMFNVPVFMFGKGVLDGSIPVNEKPDFKNPQLMPDIKIDFDKRQRAISALFDLQFDHTKPSIQNIPFLV